MSSHLSARISKSDFGDIAKSRKANAAGIDADLAGNATEPQADTAFNRLMHRTRPDPEAGAITPTN